MAPTVSLTILKAGLAALKSKAEICKNDLLNRLKAQVKISAADETWLDQEGNYVDEEALLNTLGAASSFEHALTLLNPGEKKVLDGLIEAGKEGMSASSSGQGKDVAKKRQCMCLCHSFMYCTHSFIGPEECKHLRRSRQPLLHSPTKKPPLSLSALKSWIGTLPMARTSPRLPSTSTKSIPICASSNLLSPAG